MLKELIALANELDRKGLTKEADTLDRLAKKAADNDLDSDVAGDFRWDETHLNLGDTERDPRDERSAYRYENVPVLDHIATGGEISHPQAGSGVTKGIKLVTDWILTFPTAWKELKRISLDNYKKIDQGADPATLKDGLDLLLGYLPSDISRSAAYTAVDRLENREPRSAYDDGSDELPDDWVDPITPNYEPTREDIDWTNRRAESSESRPFGWPRGDG